MKRTQRAVPCVLSLNVNNLLTEELPFEGNSVTIKTYTYDNNGNVKSSSVTSNKPGEAAKEQRTEYNYNSRNFMNRVTSYNNGVAESYVEYSYDKTGNRTLMCTANGTRLTSYQYDHLNRLTMVTDPLNQIESYGYDTNGNLTSKTDKNGVTTTNTYDRMNRLLTVTPSAGSSFMRYTYAKTGAVLTEENENLKTTYVYDSMGRRTNEKDNAGTEKRYTYDSANNRTGFTLLYNGSTKTSLTYGYDKLNRLTGVWDNGVQTAAYTYDANGNRQTLTYGNGIVAVYGYNKANLVTYVLNMKGSVTLSSYSYTYYLDGNQATKTDSAGWTTT